MPRTEVNTHYIANINETDGLSNAAVFTNKHPNTDELFIDEGNMDYSELAAAIAFNAMNLTRDNTSTYITQERISTLRYLLDRLEHYNNQLGVLETSKSK